VGKTFLPVSVCIRPPLFIWRNGMQTQINFRGNTAYWKNFKLGEILPGESTFRTVKRSRKNIFRMFDGLGINEELLLILKELNIKFIEIPFCGKTLKTTPDKFLRYGIPSRYESEKIDKQIILKVNRINLNDTSPDNQGGLFAGA
jgi:hypothetical protein